MDQIKRGTLLAQNEPETLGERRKILHRNGGRRAAAHSESPCDISSAEFIDRCDDNCDSESLSRIIVRTSATIDNIMPTTMASGDTGPVLRGLLLIWLYRCVPCSGFSPRTGSFTIVGGAGGLQYLPTSYSSRFSFWTYEGESLDPQIIKVVESNTRQDFQVRPSLDVLVKGGVPSYMMAGLQTIQGPSPALAQQWTTFNSLSVEPNVRLRLYQGPGDGTDDRLSQVSEEAVKDSIECLGLVLSSSDHDSLSAGFHVLSFPLGEWTTIDRSDPSSLVTCLITAEPDARELFTLDSDLVEMTATSYLQMKVGSLIQRV